MKKTWQPTARVLRLTPTTEFMSVIYGTAATTWFHLKIIITRYLVNYRLLHHIFEVDNFLRPESSLHRHVANRPGFSGSLMGLCESPRFLKLRQISQETRVKSWISQSSEVGRYIGVEYYYKQQWLHGIGNGIVQQSYLATLNFVLNVIIATVL